MMTHILLRTLKTHVKDMTIKLWDTLTLSTSYLHGGCLFHKPTPARYDGPECFTSLSHHL